MLDNVLNTHMLRKVETPSKRLTMEELRKRRATDGRLLWTHC